MDPEHIARDFESILAADHGLDPNTCREAPDWWRFKIDGLACQAGIHTADFRVLCTICATGSDCDQGALFADMKRHNAGLQDAHFIEADCYIQVHSECDLDEVSPARMRELLAACLAAARSPAASSLSSSYRSWD